MKYRIVTASREYALNLKVNALIEEGWVPQGGVSVVFYDAFNETWSQAMVKS